MLLEVDKPPLRSRAPWYVRLMMVSFRTLLLTLLFALLGMAIGLLTGIIATLVIAGVHHVPPDMTNAYRHAAIPAAVVSGAGAFLWNTGRAVKDAVSGR
ncbi:MAG: hypothetical protein ABSD88_08355 [Candidatus Korobacteraceae bacterium]|jgi:predicted membrane metal-binding protein